MRLKGAILGLRMERKAFLRSDGNASRAAARVVQTFAIDKLDQRGCGLAHQWKGHGSLGREQRHSLGFGHRVDDGFPRCILDQG